MGDFGREIPYSIKPFEVGALLKPDSVSGDLWPLVITWLIQATNIKQS